MRFTLANFGNCYLQINAWSIWIGGGFLTLTL